ncbi:MAG: hypothetical protein U0800_18340 [Isosphaeraceae bacterium]
MRSGSRMGVVMAWALVAASATFARGGENGTEPVRPVPLGGSLSNQEGVRAFGVYVPTRFGGQLTITTSSGTVQNLAGPDKLPRENGGEIGVNKQGWYTFVVTGAEGKFTVTSDFTQVAESARKVWNFYYWPTKGDCIHEPWAGGNARVDTMHVQGDDIMVARPGAYIAPGQDIVLPGPNGILETRPAPGDTSTWFPNQYDDLTFMGADGTLFSTPAPMLKYDQLFGTSARNWEAANSQGKDIQRWPGHCLGGAVASISLNEPNPAPGSGMTADELKALWAELGENHYNHQIGDYANEVPPGPPRPGPDPTDGYVARVHNMYERHLRGKKQALLSNMRAFPPRGTNTEVWNHGVGRYVAKYHAVPGRGELAVRVEMELQANSGSNLNNGDNKPRVVKYEYIVVYGRNGEVDETNPGANDWISVGGEAMFCPLNVMEVVSSRWQGHNPMISEANLRQIDLANGGAGSRFALAAAPQFRPVSNYEAGRGPIFALGNGNNPPNANNAPSPRRGLFGGFFGGGSGR